MFPLAHFLRQELRDAPGRASYTLRLTLSCAVLITLFMTLQIPFLAVALIVVFYVSQPNVLMIKLVSVVFFVTVSVALGGVLLIIKWTYDYPLIRLAASVALFFCAIYLMRVLGKLGLAFFVVALAVIYAQTFPSMTSQSEILVRLLLWLWVAINTAILVTLLVNACFQQAFPGNQFKARLAEMLQSVVIHIYISPQIFHILSGKDRQVRGYFFDIRKRHCWLELEIIPINPVDLKTINQKFLNAGTCSSTNTLTCLG